jgi:hypothetical protein
VADESRVKRVYLHIGAPKTGTTYLQAVLGRNRDSLAAKGLLYPASQSDAHHKAVWDLRGTPKQREHLEGIEGTWAALVGQVNQAGSDVLLSSEHFVFAQKQQVERALSSFEDAEMHVIYTARDLGRQVPAVWQERIKNQRSMTYRSFVQSLIARDGKTAKAFWNVQDPEAVLRRWSRGLRPDQVHLVTAPPTGQPHRVLWDRFAEALGLDGTDYDVDVARSNESLSMLQTEVLRRFNERHAEGLSWPQYRRLIFRQLDVLRVIGDGRRIGLTPDENAFLTRRASEITEAIAGAGYDVVGDLDDLIPAPPSDRAGDGADDPTELRDDELLEATLDVMQELLSRQADVREAAREARQSRRRAGRGPH